MSLPAGPADSALGFLPVKTPSGSPLLTTGGKIGFEDAGRDLFSRLYQLESSSVGDAAANEHV